MTDSTVLENTKIFDFFQGLKQEAECFAMQKTTFMASLQMFEDEKKVRWSVFQPVSKIKFSQAWVKSF